MKAGRYRAVVVHRRDCGSDCRETIRPRRDATMDSRDEELELVSLFQRDEERRHMMAAMDSWLLGKNQP